jgi:tRNA(Ile)-lysidine synthase
VPLPEVGLILESRLVSADGYTVPRGPGCVAFDAEGLGGPLRVRARRRGDHVVPFGSGGQRRLKSVLIDLKVPRWDRDRVPLVVAGGEIVWVGGLRRAAAAPVTATTRRVLELSLKPLAESPTAQ